MRHLIDEGIVPNKGSVASKAQVFQEQLVPVLTRPGKTFDWKIGDTPARAFAGEVDGKTVVAFVAKEGLYQGRVVSALIPSPQNMVKWGLE